MKNFDFGVYGNILAVKQAHLFDIGCFLMRIYMYMGTLGVVSMLTLSGHSAFFSGTVSSTLAISTFFIAPRTGKFMDEKGQHRVILITSIIAIARTRWTYLIESGKLKNFSTSLKSVYSYEGVIEDCSFMIGPALAIALSNTFFPTAGILLGCLSFTVGSFILLVLARDTEPQVNWKRAAEGGEEAGSNADASADAATSAKKHRSALVELPIVRVLFSLALLVGLIFGAFDTTTITFAQSIGQPVVASLGVSVSSFASMCSSLTFGMLVLKAPLNKQLLGAAIAIGAGYMGMGFITSVPMFFFISVLGAALYAPFFITANSFCEQAVPANRLTESLTWITAGSTCGLAIGPTASGALIDAFGPTAGFYLGSVACVCVIALAFFCRGIMKRNCKQHVATPHAAQELEVARN